MWRYSCFLIVCLLAAAAPLVSSTAVVAVADDDFPGWPDTWEGRSLVQLPLSEREERFLQGFPGRIARFSDSQREIVLRWIVKPTRKLHPSADCYKGAGYAVADEALAQDSG